MGVEKGQRGGVAANRLSRQEDGELCLNSAQCKSSCCHRDTGLSLARCAPKASENSECSAKVRAGGRGMLLVGRGTPQRRRALRLGGTSRGEGQPGRRTLASGEGDQQA